MAAKKNLKEMDVDTYLRGDGNSPRTITLGRQDTAQDVVLVDTELTVKAKAGGTGRIIVATDELTVVDGDKLGQIDFQAPSESDGGDAILVGASIWAEADATFSATVNSTELVFATSASETATEKMRLTSDGKLGVGTTTPNSLLHVASASNVTGITVGSSSARYKSLSWKTSSPDDLLGIESVGATGGWRGAIQFSVSYNDGSLIDAMTIKANTDGTSATVETSGKILVGTTTAPSANGGKVLAFGDNGATNPTMGTNTAGIFCKDVAGTVELYAIDEDNNATLQTPHPKDAPPDFYETSGGYEAIMKTERGGEGEIIWIHLERPNQSIKPVKLVETFADYNARTGANLQKINKTAVNNQRQAEYQEKYTDWLAKAKQRQALLSAGRYALANSVAVPDRPVAQKLLV